ncbi:MAG: LysR family transcriptional regulator, partial [Boseongicola sp.]
MSVSPPRPKGPPLNALRAFEAAARLGSFVGAAEELSVTPGAVSQHIKALEHWTKTPLFARHPKGVRLTQAGRALLPQFVLAFDHLGSAIRALQNSRPQTDIHVATMPSLAQLWLPPRLAALRSKMPNVKLSVTALETAPNLNRELFDVALFLKEPSGAASEIIIADDRIFPVCSAEVAAG